MPAPSSVIRCLSSRRCGLRDTKLKGYTLGMAVSVKKKNKAGMGNDQWLRVAILYRWWGKVIYEYNKGKRR